MSNLTPTSQRKKGSETGFSLIELLIVVSVILIIAAIAIPNFIKSKMRANEAAAVENMRTIVTANTVYLTTYGIGYAANMTKLSGNLVIVDANSAGLIDTVLASGAKTGFNYTYTPGPVDSSGHINGYDLTADPINFGATGERYFYTNQSGIVRFNTTATATASDPAI
jgi:type IV pilus assembly protein PilA